METPPKPSVKDFVLAFGRNWFVLMSGAFTVPFAALAVFADSAASKAIWASMALCMILVATYLVWAGERKTVEIFKSDNAKLRNELALVKDNSVANIKCFIGAMTTGSTNRDDKDYVGITMNISLKNLGAPSAVEQWRFEFAIDQMTIEGQLLRPDKWRMRVPNGEIEITSDDLIENRALTPVARGAIVRGWLLVALPYFISLEEARNHNNTFSLFYSDVFEREYALTDLNFGEAADGFYSLADPSSGVRFRAGET